MIFCGSFFVCSVVHVEVCEGVLLFRLAVAVFYEQRGNEAQRNEQSPVWEEKNISGVGVGAAQQLVSVFEHGAGEHRRYDLGGLRGGVVIARVFPDVRAAAHLNDHGIAVHIDGGPAEAREDEEKEDQAAEAFEEDTASEGYCQHDNTAEYGFFTADLCCDDADGDIAYDGGGLRDYERVGKGTAGKPPVDVGIFGEAGRYGVIAHEPEEDRREYEPEGAPDLRGHGGPGIIVRFGLVRNAESLRFLLREPDETRLTYRCDEDQQAYEHEADYNGEERDIIRVGGIADEEGYCAEREDAAYGAHEIDDGVSLAAQRLGRYVRHKRDGGRTVDSHGDEQQAQSGKKQRQRGHFVRDRQYHGKNAGAERAGDYIRHTPANARVCAVRQRAEQRKHEQRQYIVKSHDDA